MQDTVEKGIPIPAKSVQIRMMIFLRPDDQLPPGFTTEHGLALEYTAPETFRFPELTKDDTTPSEPDRLFWSDLTDSGRTKVNRFWSDAWDRMRGHINSLRSTFAGWRIAKVELSRTDGGSSIRLSEKGQHWIRGTYKTRHEPNITL